MHQLFNYSIITFFVVVCFCSSSLYGQDSYLVNVQAFVDEGSSDGVTVEIILERNKQSNLTVKPDGTFQTLLNWNKTYLIEFSKPGYVTKIIEFSTFLPADKNPMSIEPYNLKVRLFKLFDGVDTVFFNNPVAKIRFDKALGDFEYDMDYTLSVKYKIDAMRNQSLQAKPVQTTPTKRDEIPKATGGGGKSNIKTVDTKTKIPVKSTNATITTEVQDEDLPLDILPPLKSHYPTGRTIEVFDLNSKTVTRVVIVRGNIRNIYLKVKHQWGPIYYFHDESPLTFRCITRQTYERETGFDETHHP